MAIDLTAVAASSENHAVARTGGLRLPSRRPRMTRRDRKFFTEQLGLLLETGTPLVSALDLIARQAASPALEDAVEKVNATRLRAALERLQAESPVLAAHLEGLARRYDMAGIGEALKEVVPK